MDWIRDTLAASGMSQSKLARRMSQKLGRHIDRAMINNIVRGSRRLQADELLAAAEIFRVETPKRDGEVTDDLASHRLRAARIDAGFTSAAAAAKSFGWPPVTYRAHESGQRGLNVRNVRAYAEALGVTAGWLLTGERSSHTHSGVAEINPRSNALDPRQVLEGAAAVRGFTFSELSKRVGKNHAYLQQFVRRGTPRRLPEDVRISLAGILGIDEIELRAPPHEASKKQRLSLDHERRMDEPTCQLGHRIQDRGFIESKTPGAIPEIDVETCAGADVGEMHSAHRVIQEWVFPPDYLAHVINCEARSTLVMPVVGDSMFPTYHEGDRVIIDAAQNQLLTDAVYAIGDGLSSLQIRRLERVFNSSPPEVTIIPDNANFTRQTLPLSSVTIVGRVVGIIAKR